MDPAAVTSWASHHPYPAAALAAATLLLAAGTVWCVARAVRSAIRPQSSVVVAAIGAAVCTAYTADTSWRFAAHRLDMASTAERVMMFAAAEVALLACALMARAHKATTAETSGTSGTSGVPGILVWVITGVQVIPAYAESGLIGGTVRAVIGPVMAGLLWHLAMGLEIRVARPRALSSGLLAMIGRELRERMLSRLGLAVRDRTAEQISRDRATARAVRLASRRWLSPWGRARLAAAVARAGVGADPEQRHHLLLLLSARRGAAELTSIELRSPWQPEQPPATPRTPAALVHQQLADMHPLDAVRRVQSAHPNLNPGELAAECISHGVVVSEQLVRVAIGAPNPPRTPAPVPEVHPERTRTPAPEAPASEPEPLHRFVLDLAPMHLPHPEVCAPAPVAALDPPRRLEVHATVPSGFAPEPAETDPLLDQARALAPGRTPSLRQLKSLGIGQARAQRLQTALTTTAP
ncbi:hypothetical protein LHJ74_14610 [Streptomyces sp. N2-109]|uniref:Integral membrane protein n=1 Tax=Streptomyces gossypii TaxID=2883101 RepID=A0ABT2JTC0_9ACTN|nr:hypothetical protein [Streptomyces gossypii]MCT2591125.1 hypothetical protein [Streptomyces gossypii]